MDINGVKLLFDFGLLVLIWLIQLVVYPSFSYYQKSELLQWHKIYVLRIGYVVMPLMIGQLALALIVVYQKLSVFNFFSLGLTISVWLSTFLQFVPLHTKISSSFFDSEIVNKLVKQNWVRTILWSLIFSIGCMNYITNN